MATFSHLPVELLVHILCLSNETEFPSSEEQRARFQFGLVSRACFLATASATDFHVAGEKQAKALVSKLEREKGWAAQEERKTRTTRASFRFTRISKVHRLFINMKDDAEPQKGFVDLLRAAPNLVALGLFLGNGHNPRISPELALVLGNLADLRELRIVSKFMERADLLRILSTLTALEVLDLRINDYRRREKLGDLLQQLSLPHHHTLAIHPQQQPDTFPNRLIPILAKNSTIGIQTLTFNRFFGFCLICPLVIEPLVPILVNILRLVWTPYPSYPLETDNRDAVLAFLGAMQNLESRCIATWTTHDQNPRINCPDFFRVDHTLFETLATLPSLKAVKIVIEDGVLRAGRIVSFLESHNNLRSLSLHFSNPEGCWTTEERETVQEVAEEAGITFEYHLAKD